MKNFILLATMLTIPSVAWAACPAAPVGSTDDRVIQMVAGVDGLTQMGSDANVDATEEGAIVYDGTNDILVVCDGTNWVPLGGSSGGGGGIQSGQSNTETLGTGCTNIGDLARTSTGNLIVCKDTQILQG